MNGLQGTDIDTLADVVHALGELDDLAAFRAEVLGQMRRLVVCDIAAYNEIGLTPEEVIVVADPPDSLQATMAEPFAVHAHQNPLVAHHASHPAAPAARLSDLIGRRELHRLELYDLVYRPLGTEYQAALTVPTTDRVVGITASRASRDFRESEVGLLDAVGPFVVAALRNITMRGRIDATLAALEYASGPPAGILFLSDSMRIEASDDRAERWLGPPCTARSQLTERLEQWARQHVLATGDIEQANHPPDSCMIDHIDGPHRARYVPGNAARPAAILIETPRVDVRSPDLTGLGLTRRQSDVLELVTAGNTNAQIATILGLSERTIAHHLEHIFRRLGVATRTAAVRRAGEHLGQGDGVGRRPR